MKAEDRHWGLIYNEYINAPADGLKGRGMSRKSDYVANDANLLTIYRDRANREPYRYLRSIAHRMPDPS